MDEMAGTLDSARRASVHMYVVIGRSDAGNVLCCCAAFLFFFFLFFFLFLLLFFFFVLALPFSQPRRKKKKRGGGGAFFAFAFAFAFAIRFAHTHVCRVCRVGGTYGAYVDTADAPRRAAGIRHSAGSALPACCVRHAPETPTACVCEPGPLGPNPLLEDCDTRRHSRPLANRRLLHFPIQPRARRQSAHGGCQSIYIHISPSICDTYIPPAPVSGSHPRLPASPRRGKEKKKKKKRREKHEFAQGGFLHTVDGYGRTDTDGRTEMRTGPARQWTSVRIATI